MPKSKNLLFLGNDKQEAGQEEGLERQHTGRRVRAKSE